MRWQIIYTKDAQKDAKKIAAGNLRPQVQKLLDILQHDPLQNPPHYEKLLGDLDGAYSRRINIKHRLVYQVLPRQKIVKILRMWTHYE